MASVAALYQSEQRQKWTDIDFQQCSRAGIRCDLSKAQPREGRNTLRELSALWEFGEPNNSRMLDFVDAISFGNVTTDSWSLERRGNSSMRLLLLTNI